MPKPLLTRHDEIGALAVALSDSAAALWGRMDAIEHFAADVAHEIKNPLTSIRSAIETLRRIEDPAPRQRLLAIIAEDVQRLDRLISDITDASRIDAELSRVATERVDVAPILHMLKELDDATRGRDGPRLLIDAPAGALLTVQAVGDRLVQVLRNLIGNAQSFSPPNGRIWLRAREEPNMVDITIEDEGPGIPEARLEHIFDRFYSERPSGRACSASTPAWVCRSAGRSSRRCAGASPRRTGAAPKAAQSARGSWYGCRRRNDAVAAVGRNSAAHSASFGSHQRRRPSLPCKRRDALRCSALCRDIIPVGVTIDPSASHSRHAGACRHAPA